MGPRRCDARGGSVYVTTANVLEAQAPWRAPLLACGYIHSGSSCMFVSGCWGTLCPSNRWKRAWQEPIPPLHLSRGRVKQPPNHTYSKPWPSKNAKQPFAIKMWQGGLEGGSHPVYALPPVSNSHAPSVEQNQSVLRLGTTHQHRVGGRRCALPAHTMCCCKAAWHILSRATAPHRHKPGQHALLCCC